MKLGFAVLSTIALLSGCYIAESDSFFPLIAGKKWTYEVRTGFVKTVEEFELRPRGEKPDRGSYAFSSDIGTSVFSWKAGTLYLEQAPRIFFDTPMPILLLRNEVKKVESSMMIAGKKFPVRGTVKCENNTVKIGGRSIPVRTSVIEVKVGTMRYRLETWFQIGVGIIRQEQRVNGELDFALELLANT